MLLNDSIVDNDKPDGVYLPIFFQTFVQGYFYIHQSFLLNIQEDVYKY